MTVTRSNPFSFLVLWTIIITLQRQDAFAFTATSSSSLSSTTRSLARSHNNGIVSLQQRQPQPAFIHHNNVAALQMSTSSNNNNKDYEFALLFDCDGVILETEELHRQAYNAAFHEFGLTIDGKPVEWSVEYYDMLQNSIGGGKPKMWFHFRNTTGTFPMVKDQPAPTTQQEQQALIDAIQDWKTAHYKQLLETQAKPRPGVLALMDEALADDRIAVGVCSASTKEAALKTLDITLGPERVSKLDVCILGDDVATKKPDPMIYNVARERLGITDPTICVVIEDSLIGLKAAKGAGMKCIITFTESTADCNFYANGADAVIPDLASRHVTLDSIFGVLRAKGLKAEMMVGMKDPMAFSFL